ncbi:helix-turn-helix domain-containing protein [Parasphingorhabdus sp.]|uniref:helix-turn-helix transcriptional regulator n=1 Tax=Parasphingorhabdus sp. TaxID=2709688 RepID=UPI003266D957
MFPTTDKLPTFFNQAELAERWRISQKTLERWRYEGKKPSFVKIHGRVLYRSDDILEFEKECGQQNIHIPDLDYGHE